MLHEGANVNFENENLFIKLHCAAKNPHTDLVKPLIEKETNVNTKDKKKQRTKFQSFFDSLNSVDHMKVPQTHHDSQEELLKQSHSLPMP